MSDAGTVAVAARPENDRRQRETAALYDAHGRRAYRLAFVLLADELAAADAVAEAFSELRHRSRLRREPRARQGTLLLRGVYRAASAALERRPLAAGSDDRRPSLSGLPPAEREALLLCMHGVSCTELAATGRMSRAEVAGALTRALRHARDTGGAGPVRAAS